MRRIALWTLAVCGALLALIVAVAIIAGDEDEDASAATDLRGCIEQAGPYAVHGSEPVLQVVHEITGEVGRVRVGPNRIGVLSAEGAMQADLGICAATTEP